MKESDFEKLLPDIHKNKINSLKTYIKKLKDKDIYQNINDDIINKIIKKNFKEFKKLIKSCEITTDAIPFLMNKLQINIIMIQDTNRKLYNLEIPYNNKNFYIIMLNLSNFHYESCGILYSDKNNNAIIDYVLYPTENFVHVVNVVNKNKLITELKNIKNWDNFNLFLKKRSKLSIDELKNI